MPQLIRPAKSAVAATLVAVTLIPTGAVVAAQAATTKTVKLNAQQFSPRNVTIHKGDRVTFKWIKGLHTLVGSQVRVGARSRGSKTVTFKKAGTFRFTCTLHANMTMKVKVT